MTQPPHISFARGFTLIELLATIAIIGILSSVVVASITTSRQKSRDAKRIAETHQIERALQLYYDANQSYPSTTPAGYSGADAGIAVAVAAGLLPHIPLPPAGVDPVYRYHGLYQDASGATHECDASAPQGTDCDSFELGITLERSENTALANDADQQVGTFYGAGAACGSNTPGDEQCFDIKG